MELDNRPPNRVSSSPELGKRRFVGDLVFFRRVCWPGHLSASFLSLSLTHTHSHKRTYSCCPVPSLLSSSVVLLSVPISPVCLLPLALPPWTLVPRPVSHFFSPCLSIPLFDRVRQVNEWTSCRCAISPSCADRCLCVSSPSLFHFVPSIPRSLDFQAPGISLCPSLPSVFLGSLVCGRGFSS